MAVLDETVVHKFSQLVYLDTVPDIGARLTVGELAGYYLNDRAGAAYLKARFGGIPAEYESWQMFLSRDIEDVKEWRVDGVEDHNLPGESGFYACAYLSPDGEVVAAFRGSEMLGDRYYKNDYETDFALAYTDKTPQQKEAEDYLNRLGGLCNGSCYLTGHSLGGNLALHAAIYAPDATSVAGSYAFNAPGFSYEYIQSAKGRINAALLKLRAYQNKYDLVSSLLLDIAEPIIVSSAFDPGAHEPVTIGGLLYPHSNFLFLQDGAGFIRDPDGVKSPACMAVKRFSRAFLLLPEPVKKAAAKIALEILYSGQPPEKQAQFLLERVAGLLIKSGAPDMGDGGLSLSGGLHIAKELWRGSKSEGELYGALSGGELSGQSEIARTWLLILRLLLYRRRSRVNFA